MKRNMLTSEERSKILDLRKKGHSLNGISRETKRSVDTVRKFIRDPAGYTKIVNSYYKELKATTTPKKKITTSSSSSKVKKVIKPIKVKKVTKAKSNTLKDVNLEHRAVIKFLTKQGQSVTQIFSNMKKVYTNAVLDYDSVKFWCYEYKNGRETLLNEATSKKSSPIKNSMKKSKATTIKKSKTTATTTPKKLKTATKSKTVYIWKAKPQKSASKIKLATTAATKKTSGTIKKKLTQVKKTISKASKVQRAKNIMQVKKTISKASNIQRAKKIIQVKKTISKASSSVQTSNNIVQDAIKQELKTAPVKKNLFQIKLLPISKKIFS